MATGIPLPSADPGVPANLKRWYDVEWTLPKGGSRLLAAVCHASNSAHLGDGQLRIYKYAASTDYDPLTASPWPVIVEPNYVELATLSQRRDGTLDLVYTYRTSTAAFPAFELRHRYSEDQGETWSAADTIALPATATLPSRFDGLLLSCRFSGLLLVRLLMWETSYGNNRNYLFAGSEDGSGDKGLAWSAATPFDGSPLPATVPIYHALQPLGDGRFLAWPSRSVLKNVRADGTITLASAKYSPSIPDPAWMHPQAGGEYLQLTQSWSGPWTTLRWYWTYGRWNDGVVTAGGSSVGAIVPATGEFKAEQYLEGWPDPLKASQNLGAQGVCLRVRDDGAFEFLFPDTAGALQFRRFRRLPNWLSADFPAGSSPLTTIETVP